MIFILQTRVFRHNLAFSSRSNIRLLVNIIEYGVSACNNGLNGFKRVWFFTENPFMDWRVTCHMGSHSHS